MCWCVWWGYTPPPPPHPPLRCRCFRFASARNKMVPHQGLLICDPALGDGPPPPPEVRGGWRFAIARNKMVPHPPLRCRGWRFAIARQEMVPHPPLWCRCWRFVQDSWIGGGGSWFGIMNYNTADFFQARHRTARQKKQQKAIVTPR